MRRALVGTLLVFAVTTMRKIPVSGELGDA